MLTSSGRNVDRNLVIVTLYNLATCYQKYSCSQRREGNNAECVRYLDGALYNLRGKVSEIPEISDNSVGEKLRISNQLMKLRLHTRFRLQLCAMLSQVNE
eukprot:TRINITY_DN10443_c0_g3_i1.p2 TRINITY_DN10443_c0_g3~~TRINITY_DN10443_c0_g3_i1.p2  ORF type:complete len:100 (-),score=21.74 TRINITY_DN10443_c0_g3_i1:221-520(-)